MCDTAKKAWNILCVTREGAKKVKKIKTSKPHDWFFELIGKSTTKVIFSKITSSNYIKFKQIVSIDNTQNSLFNKVEPPI